MLSRRRNPRPPRMRQVVVLALAAALSTFALAGAIVPRGQAQSLAASGAPILIVTSDSDHFGLYYDDILQAEGLPEHDRIDVSALTPDVLSQYTTVVLAHTATEPSAAV